MKYDFETGVQTVSIWEFNSDLPMRIQDRMDELLKEVIGYYDFTEMYGHMNNPHFFVEKGYYAIGSGVTTINVYSEQERHNVYERIEEANEKYEGRFDIQYLDYESNDNYDEDDDNSPMGWINIAVFWPFENLIELDDSAV